MLQLGSRRTNLAHRPSSKKGFTLMAMVASATMIFGAAGLAIDMGRLYIARNEAQSFADSAALYGALKIDCTSTGLTNAENAVGASVQKWNFATTAFSGT